MRNPLSNHLAHISYVKNFIFAIVLPSNYFLTTTTTHVPKISLESTAIFNFSYIVSQIKYEQKCFKITRSLVIKVQVWTEWPLRIVQTEYIFMVAVVRVNERFFEN